MAAEDRASAGLDVAEARRKVERAKAELNAAIAKSDFGATQALIEKIKAAEDEERRAVRRPQEHDE